MPSPAGEYRRQIAHFLFSPFFKTIAVRRLTTREGTVEAPFIQVQRSILTSLLSDCWAAMKDEPETLHARLNRTIQPVRQGNRVKNMFS